MSRVGIGSARLHWRCPRCERELAVDLSKPYDPRKLRCCNLLFTVGTKQDVTYLRINKDKRISVGVTNTLEKVPVKSWNEEN